jgi:hypothetical protein
VPLRGFIGRLEDAERVMAGVARTDRALEWSLEKVMSYAKEHG